jgi:hypothetical protein
MTSSVLKVSGVAAVLAFAGCGPGMDTVASSAGSVATASSCRYEGSWQTIDELQYPGISSAPSRATAVAVGPTGIVYVAGWAADALNVRHLMVRATADAGKNWNTVLNTQYSAGFDSEASGIAVNSAGKFMLTGYGMDGAGATTWISLFSTDGGATTTTDAYLPVGVQANGMAVVALADGTFLNAGSSIRGLNNVKQGEVRASSAAGVWSQVARDQYQVSNTSTSINGLAASSSGSTLITVGAGQNQWFARVSTNSGQSWTTTDSAYHLPLGSSAVATRVELSSDGTAYAVGCAAGNLTFDFHWIVRISQDSGQSWQSQNSDDYQPEAGVDAYAVGLALDTRGLPVVGGYSRNAALETRWRIRRLGAAGGAWTTSDDLACDSGGLAKGVAAIARDSTGALYAVGDCNSSPSRWTVRKQNCN